jgi:hypothetical protein
MSASATLRGPCPEAALSASPQPELRRLLVSVSEAEVVISGRVSCFYLKQLAQETVKPTADGKRVVNKVEVYD